MTRIAVSGAHCTGKSTLIDDFLAGHRDYVHLPEPFELAEVRGELLGADADSFRRQLELCTEQLERHADTPNFIAERSPIDFLAYLLALGEPIDDDIAIALQGMQHIDVLVILDATEIEAPEDEEPELREEMNARLFDLAGNDDFTAGVRVVEARGGVLSRNATLAILDQHHRRRLHRSP